MISTTPQTCFPQPWARQTGWVNRPPRSYRLTGRQEVIGFGGRPHEVIGFGDLWGPSGTSGDHLGHGFDEVIDFITESDLPECADRSV